MFFEENDFDYFYKLIYINNLFKTRNIMNLKLLKSGLIMILDFLPHTNLTFLGKFQIFIKSLIFFRPNISFNLSK